MAFFSQPGIWTTRLYLPSGSSARWGVRDIFVHERQEILRDCHVVGVCHVDYPVLDVGGDAHGYRRFAGRVLWRPTHPLAHGKRLLYGISL